MSAESARIAAAIQKLSTVEKLRLAADLVEKQSLGTALAVARMAVEALELLEIRRRGG